MIRLFIAAALAAAIATPALSQGAGRHDGEGAYAASQTTKRAAKARKKTPRRAVARSQRAAPKPCAAYYWGGCLGWDPDPNVRSMIQMDSRLWDD
ncbi:MAG: hypothetical protein ACRECO_13945 [Xanthobacteraceae bacterium]